ncbi:MAG: hypothetical protein WC758_07770 [Candidatus Woesearchaeota archaeon]|jgi:hypothetical protein
MTEVVYQRGKGYGGGFTWVMIAGVILLIFLTGGGAKTIFDLGQFASKVPVWVWGVLIVIFVFRMRK